MNKNYITPFCEDMSFVNDMPVCVTSLQWSGNIENLNDDNGDSAGWYEL